MPEPPTHYQLSFTSRQAMALFVALLLVLGLAYFLGLMTGLAGREGVKTAGAATPARLEPTASERIAAAVPSPTAIRPLRATVSIPAFPKPVLGKEPTAASSIQLFEDRSESETTRAAVEPAATRRQTAAATPSKPAGPPEPKASPAPAAAGGEFWVQVTSSSSEREARARRDKLIHRGYRVRVLLAEGPKGKIYRVRVGPYASRDEASRAAERLSREEKVKAWIAPAGK